MSVRSARYNRLSLRSPKGTSALPKERDAWAFLDAAGITSSRQQEAIITLVRDLKGYGLWSKMKAIYPFVGGTATTHKWNLKDPRDADAAFRLTFSGGWTHASTGATPNGTNGYANTFFVPNTNSMNYNDMNISYYSRTSASSSGFYDIGAGDDIFGVGNVAMFVRRTANTYAVDFGDAGGNRISISNTNGSGYFLGNSNSTIAKIYRNGTSLSSNTLTNKTTSIYNIYLGGYNEGGTAKYFMNHECSFCTLGTGLTDTDATNLYNAVDRFQKFLGRAV